MSNQLPLLPSPARPPEKWKFSFGDRIGIDIGKPNGTFYRFVDTVGHSHTFEVANLPGTHEIFTDADIAACAKTKGWRYNSSWYTRQEVEARRASGVDNLALLPKKDMAEVIRRMTWIQKILQYCEIGRYSLTDATLELIIAEKTAEIIEVIKAEIGKRRAGKKVEAEAPPSVRTLWRWLELYWNGGSKPEALRPKYFARPKPAPWAWDADVEVLIRTHVENYASENRPTQDQAYEDLKTDVADLNQRRAAVDVDPVACPCAKVFKKRIRALGKFAVFAGRHGFDKAMKRFHYVTIGLDVTAASQRVEIDCWEIQLQALLVQAKVWEALSEDLRKKIKRQRFMLCMALDAASRAVLGMRVGYTENTDLAIETIKIAARQSG